MSRHQNVELSHNIWVANKFFKYLGRQPKFKHIRNGQVWIHSGKSCYRSDQALLPFRLSKNLRSYVHITFWLVYFKGREHLTQQGLYRIEVLTLILEKIR